MKRAWLLLWIMLIPAAHSAAMHTPQQEIDHLLEFVGASGCVFYRNGSSYSSLDAQAHLRTKYETPSVHGRIQSADEFIERIASASSLTGRPYSVRCGGAEETSTRAWLADELRRFRAQ